MRMRWNLFLVFFLLGALFAASAEENTTFQLLRGRVSLSRNGGSTWLDLGPEPINVSIQDMLRTEGETRGELHFPDGSLFRLKSNSVVTILADGLLIQVGESWLNLKKQGRTFQVITPTTVCGVLGTTFDVAVDKFGRTQVRVFEGLVSVKSCDDQRRRQLVLQRGMQTTVRNRGFTGDQIQKFDPGAVETQINRDWNRKSLSPIKVGPGRSGLPPIRPSLSDGFRSLKKDDQMGRPTKDQNLDENGPESDVRGRMNFFEGLREQRLKEREKIGDRTGDRKPDSGGDTFRQQYPGKPFANDGKPVDPNLLREGHGRPFGQSTPSATGLQDERMLQEEILKVQNDLAKIQGETKQAESELDSLKKKAAELGSKQGAKPGTNQGTNQGTKENGRQGGTQESTSSHAVPSSTGNPPTNESLSLSETRDRIQKVLERLSTLREQQRKLLSRLTDLRNRLR